MRIKYIQKKIVLLHQTDFDFSLYSYLNLGVLLEVVGKIYLFSKMF